MNAAEAPTPGSFASRVSPGLRGHLFLFDRPPAPTYSARQGLILLIVFFLVEVWARSLSATAAVWLSVAKLAWWPLAHLSFVTSLAVVLIVRLARVPLAQLGLYSWRLWSKTEQLYLIQVIPIAIVVFSSFNSASLAALWTRSDLPQIGLFVFLPNMIWGFYQELLYRGILQTELVRRWGTRTGLLASNLIFTFGPLHWYHFAQAQRNPSHLWIFAAIFAIGLFFAILFKRSGNLWMIAIMHGLGDWFLDGLNAVARMAR